MSTKHTPGPWEVQHIDNFNGGAIICEVGAGFIVVAPNQVAADGEAADARLIAAAPELLAALRDVIGWVPGQIAWHTDEPMKAVDRARAVLAKATGSAT